MDRQPPATWATGLPAVISTVTRATQSMGIGRAVRSLRVINQPEGFDCPGCAWPVGPPGTRHHVEFCESGANSSPGTRSRIFALDLTSGSAKPAGSPSR